MGYITIDRKLFEHQFWQEKRLYSRFEAWLDLIQLVSWKNDNKEIINGILVKWGRGQFPVSYSFLGERWRWGEYKVRLFFKMLKDEGQIATNSTNRITIITLCNYDKYNNPQQTDNRQNVQISQENSEYLSKNNNQTTDKETGVIDSNKGNNQDGQQADNNQNNGSATGRQQSDNNQTTGNKEDKEDKEEEKAKEISEPEGSAPPKSPQKDSDADKDDYIAKIIVVFAEEYKLINQVDYVVMAVGKERAAASKILTKHKKKWPRMNSEETMESLRIYFRACVAINDDWLQRNMSLPVIVSKFNEINNILRNEHKRKRNGNGVTDAELAEITSKHFATDYHQ